MNARRRLIAALSEDSVGGVATLYDVVRAEQKVNAHRSEVLREAADIVTNAFHGEPFLNYPPDFAALLRERANEKQQATGPAPVFFQAGRTYTRQSHGSTAEFDVRHIEIHPDGYPVAFGWYRRQPRTSWHPYTSSDYFEGWTDAPAGGEGQ